ncbi:cell division protein FtsA [Patescibacteria group bacterium]
MSENIIVGLDVGSHAVRMAAGEIVRTGEKEQLHLLGAVEVPSFGIKRGTVSNIEDVVSSISACRERLERLLGAQIENIYTSINSIELLCQESKGLVGVSRTNGEIEQDDVDRALEQAQTIATPSNYEILQVLPKGYSVDGQPNIKDPLGMTGIRLEVDTLLLQVPLTHLKNLTKCTHRTGLNINDVVLGVLANAETLLTPRQKDVGAAVINLGASTTSVAVYEEGDLLKIFILPLGADYITQDINLCFKISLDVAEKIKIKYGVASPKGVSKKEEINLADEGFNGEETVSRRALAEIIEARVEEIFSKVNDELKVMGRAGLLPAGVVLCGGGAKLQGIVDVAKKELKLPVALSCPLNVSSVSEKIGDPAYATAISLVKWGSEDQIYSTSSIKGIFKGLKILIEKSQGVVKDNFKSIWK